MENNFGSFIIIQTKKQSFESTLGWKIFLAQGTKSIIG